MRTPRLFCALTACLALLSLSSSLVAASLNLSLAQTNENAVTTTYNLTSEGDLDWAAWDGGDASPAQTMSNGIGFTSLTAVGSANFGAGSYRGGKSWSWTKSWKSSQDGAGRRSGWRDGRDSPDGHSQHYSEEE